MPRGGGRLVVVVVVVVVVAVVVVAAVVVVVVVVVVVCAVWFLDGTLFWHVSFENHARGVVFEKQLSAIKCLFRLSISDTLLFAVLLRVYRFYIGFVTNYGLGAITLSFSVYGESDRGLGRGGMSTQRYGMSENTLATSDKQP